MYDTGTYLLVAAARQVTGRHGLAVQFARTDARKQCCGP